MYEDDNFCIRNGHYFLRIRRWWLKTRNRRWKCLFCGMVTGRYDGRDAQMHRPVHPAMSVAMPRVNAFPGRID
jgi:hypothetical protein